ncbi:hypothetical protein T638_17145 [Escherichia coli MRSN 10204]|nr:Hypothetical protein FORC43_2520 [Escherichia coli]KFH94414.1 hypothetical protein GR02_24425 [Escherichia coli]KKJ13192.1 hypothetical protein T638_17145 [Escherichia coli MRSN 10204]KQJ11858.1 hypothetical protein AM266_24425 [Escherichia coli]MCH6950307.1 hypothetical protein [Escherichia coli]
MAVSDATVADIAVYFYYFIFTGGAKFGYAVSIVLFQCCFRYPDAFLRCGIWAKSINLSGIFQKQGDNVLQFCFIHS